MIARPAVTPRVNSDLQNEPQGANYHFIYTHARFFYFPV
jgi:hypothetical protein